MKETDSIALILLFFSGIGCYVLLPLCILAALLAFILQVPLEAFGDANAQILLLVFTLILGPGCWILNKILPKMTFSYHEGVFSKERSGKVETFSQTDIAEVVMESPVIPDYIHFYLHDRKNPVKVLMKGFKQDDRFDIPHKVTRITKMPLTRVEKRMLNDINK